jgi:hypothetical protein
MKSWTLVLLDCNGDEICGQRYNRKPLRAARRGDIIRLFTMSHEVIFIGDPSWNEVHNLGVRDEETGEIIWRGPSRIEGLPFRAQRKGQQLIVNYGPRPVLVITYTGEPE